ncbi:oligosaccharide flippase family protein [Chitinophaga dinghuensis]|nr:oligosaccharide flippase family protein [Chitinophaga dinghuensis]
MFTGEVVTLLVAFISGYFYARFLGPETYGIWQTAKVFINLSAVFSLSLPFVMRRDFITLQADGKTEEAHRIAHIVLTYQLIITPLVSIGLLIYAFTSITNHLLQLSVVTVALIYIAQIVGAYGNILTKGLNNYKVLRNASILSGILTLVSIPVVYFWGYTALLITTLLIAVANSLYYFIKRPIAYKLYWNNTLFKSLLFVTIPLYLQDISATIFEGIDRLIIAKYLDFKEVGLYSLASFINLPLKLFVNSLSIVLFTHLNAAFGSTVNDDVIKKHVILPQEVLCQIIPPVIGVVIALLLPAVTIFLPKYTDGVPAAQISVFATYFYLLTGFSANAMFVLNKQKISALIFFIVGVVNTVLCLVVVRLKLGISGIAGATLVAYWLFDILMIGSVFKQMQRSFGELIAYKTRQLIPILTIGLFTVLYQCIIRKYIQDAWHLSIYAESAIAVALTGIVSLPFLLKGMQKLKLIL